MTAAAILSALVALAGLLAKLADAFAAYKGSQAAVAVQENTELRANVAQVAKAAEVERTVAVAPASVVRDELRQFQRD